MADLRIWAGFEQIDAAIFVVIVCAVRTDGAGVADVRTGQASSRDAAEALRRRMMRELCGELRRLGASIVDVED
jgi:hypothetical protein